MDALDILRYLSVASLLATNIYIGWRCVRVMKFLFKSRKMANAIFALFKTVESLLVFAVVVSLLILLAFLPLPQWAESLMGYLVWTIMTGLMAFNITRIDRMFSDTEYRPRAPVE